MVQAIDKRMFGSSCGGGERVGTELARKGPARAGRAVFTPQRRVDPKEWLSHSPGKVHLIVSGYGAYLAKRSERLVVKEEGHVTAEVPFADLEQVTIVGNGALLSSDVVYHCTEHGVAITFLSPNGRPYARISSPTLHASVATRRAQMLAMEDHRGVVIAKRFVEGKIRNQAVTLKYFGKYRRGAQPDAYRKLMDSVRELEASLHELDRLDAPQIDDIRSQLLSVEGRAGKAYWDAIGVLLEGKADFHGREHRGATDPVNATLNYGYGVLYNEAWAALLLAGLEPFAGFLHVDRPGKPSLVLDFVEEFRQAVVDRPLLADFIKGFTPAMEDGQLAISARRRIAETVLERLESQEEYGGKRHRLRTILHLQARRLATALRQESEYRPFVSSW